MDEGIPDQCNKQQTKAMENTNKSNWNKIVIFIFYFVLAEHQPLPLSIHHPSGDAVLGHVHVQHQVSALQDRHTLLPFQLRPYADQLEDVELGQPVGNLLQLDDASRKLIV